MTGFITLQLLGDQFSWFVHYWYSLYLLLNVVYGICCAQYNTVYDYLTVWLPLYMYSTLHHCMIDVGIEQLEQTWLITTVRLHCTMLHPELMCVVLYIDNVRQPKWRQIRPAREWQAKMWLLFYTCCLRMMFRIEPKRLCLNIRFTSC